MNLESYHVITNSSQIEIDRLVIHSGCDLAVTSKHPNNPLFPIETSDD